MATTAELRGPAGRALAALAAVLAVVIALAGCGSGGDAAQPVPASTDATSSAPVTTDDPTTTTTTTSSTPTSRPLSEDVIEVPVDEGLVQLVPRFGDQARLSRDATFDVRRCDAFPFASLPVAQAEATFSEPDAELVVGVYLFPDVLGAATFWEDYENSLLACSGGDVVVTEDLGENASTVPFDTDSANRVLTIVQAAEVVWVVQKTTPSGPAELTDGELARLGDVTG